MVVMIQAIVPKFSIRVRIVRDHDTGDGRNMWGEVSGPLWWLREGRKVQLASAFIYSSRVTSLPDAHPHWFFVPYVEHSQILHG